MKLRDNHLQLLFGLYLSTYLALLSLIKKPRYFRYEGNGLDESVQ